MIKTISNLGEIGVIKDVDSRLIPDNAYTDTLNMRFKNGSVEKALGVQEIFTAPAVDPLWILPIVAGDSYWVYPSLDKIYVTDGTTNTNITRQTASVDVDYTGGITNVWNGGVLGNIPVLNNGVDSPQMWNSPAVSTKMSSLTYDSGNTWDDVLLTTAVIRPFKKFLVALDTTEAGTRYKQRVRWSHPADSGAIPTTWDATDPTKDAGYYDLDEGGGQIIDCLPLGETNILYKDGATMGMQYIGGQYIFRFYNIFENVGLFAPRCVKHFFGKHFVVTRSDVIVHDGSTMESVIDKKNKKELFALIDKDYYKLTFVATNFKENEMLICFPSVGSTTCDKAMVWNFKDNTWSLRDLPNIKHMGYGVVNTGESDLWDDDIETWEESTDVWDTTAYRPSDLDNIMVGVNKFYLADSSYQFDGVDYRSMLERNSLDLDSSQNVKHVKRLWINGEITTDLTVYVGYQMEYNDGITWNEYTYQAGDKKIDIDVSGRFISLKFESTTNDYWRLTDYSLEYELKGRF